MQERYLGDATDCGKYLLLRALVGTDDGGQVLRLGINWYLTDPTEVDEPARRNGEQRPASAYQLVTDLDPGLAAELRRFDDPRARRLSVLEGAGVLPTETVHFSEPLSLAPHASTALKRRARMAWHGRALDRLAAADLVFLDPDNGLEVDSFDRHHKRGPKYAFLDEVVPFIEAHQSVVITQFPPRTGPRVDSVEQLADFERRLREIAEVDAPIWALRFALGTVVSFFVIPAKEHDRSLGRRRDALLASGAGRAFTLSTLGRSGE